MANKLQELSKKGNKWQASRYNLFAQIPGKELYAGINLFSGSCNLYSKEELYLLSRVEFLNNNHPILDHFRKRGLIVNFDELEALECMGRLSGAAPDTVSITICPTMACNFRCPYCFLDHFDSTMSNKVLDEVVDLALTMLEKSGADKLRIRWFGGEPLLRTDIVEDLSKRLINVSKKCGAKYEAIMYTNGYLLTQDIVDMLGDNEINHIIVTVDGIGNTHDKTRHLVDNGKTFDKIINNLRSIQFPFRVDIRQNIHEENFHEVEKLKKLVNDIAKESGNNYKYIASPVSSTYMKDSKGASEISKRDRINISTKINARDFGPARSKYCDAGSIWTIAINSDGRLFRCWEHIDDNRYSFGYVGDWKVTDPIRTADNPNMFSAFLNEALSVSDAQCKECVWLPVCMGGCPYRKLEKTNSCLSWKNNSEEYVLEVYNSIYGKETED